MSNKMTLLSLFILLNVIIHQYECGEENLWQKFRTNYWESKDGLACYRSVTLQLFENLKKIVDSSVVESAETEFKSKVQPQSNISFFNKENETNEKLLKQQIKEAEDVAYTGLYNIRHWLLYKCNGEKQKQIMEFTKIFKEGRSKCEDPTYLDLSIWWLERTCGPLVTEKNPQVIPTTATWKSGVSSMEYGPYY